MDQPKNTKRSLRRAELRKRKRRALEVWLAPTRNAGSPPSPRWIGKEARTPRYSYRSWFIKSRRYRPGPRRPTRHEVLSALAARESLLEGTGC